jgi:hypothetical protein
MSVGVIATSLLLVEAVLSLVTVRRRGERLAEAVAFFLLAALLSVLDVVELASELAGAPLHTFSPDLTQRLGSEMLDEAEKTVSSALAWSQAAAVASTVAFTALLAASVVTGGVAVVAASLAHAGLGFVQALANSALVVATAYRFVGQLYLAVAKAGGVAKTLLPLSGALMVSRSTRKLGATLFAICFGLSLALPAALNAVARSVRPWESKLEVSEVGLVEFEPLLSTPFAIARGTGQNILSFEKIDIPAPPGLVVVYEDAAGRVVVRQAGRWFAERASRYKIAGAVYGVYWVPVKTEFFDVSAGMYANLSCQESTDPRVAPVCVPVARNATRVRFSVSSESAPLVLFRDASSSAAQARGWGLWIGKGFFVLKGSERRGTGLWWYNVEGYLENHEVVGVPDPLFCDARKGNGRPPPELGLDGPAPNATVEYVEVTAWIEGDIDYEALCVNGRPMVSDSGESLVVINGTAYRLRPELWCEISFEYPPLPDARDSLSLWFDQFARAVNASLPPNAEVDGTQRCFYGNSSCIYALAWNGRTLYSQALWPEDPLPKVVVTARYYGNITRPAAVGPVLARAKARSFTASLALVEGVGWCESVLFIRGTDTMNESVVLGLAYDSSLEDFLNGEIMKSVRESVHDIIGCVGTLALVAASLFAVALGVGMLSSVLGGASAFFLPPLGPLKYPLIALRELGSALVSVARSVIEALVFRGAQTRIARGAFAEEAYNTLRQIQREIESLRKLPPGPKTRKEEMARSAKQVLGFALGYSDSHPLPLTLRLASEAARWKALKIVPKDLPYAERLRLAFTHSVAARLLLASDVLYALSWILDAKPLTTPFASGFARSIWKEYRLIHPKQLKLDDLLEGSKSGSRAELEKALAKLSRELLKGRVREESIEKVSEALAKSVLPPGTLELLEGGLIGSGDDLGWRIATLAARLDLHRPELLNLVRSRPPVALRLADLAALDRLSLSRPWKAAVFEGLSKLGHGGAELASVWLSAVEREEGWRYLARRLASEPSGQLWFSPNLPAQVRELVETLLEIRRRDVDYPTQRFLEGGSRGGFEDRMARGFVEALKGIGVDLRAAAEALVLSGDPYWAGYAVALAVENGTVNELIKVVAEVSARNAPLQESVYSEELAAVKGFLERAYRELARAVATVEEGLMNLPKPLPPLNAGLSIAIAAEADARVSRERELLEDLIGRIDNALNVISALTAEANEVKVKARVLGGTSLKEWQESLVGFEKLLASTRAELEELRMQARYALRMKNKYT